MIYKFVKFEDIV